jgi:hypothetical protein
MDSTVSAVSSCAWPVGVALLAFHAHGVSGVFEAEAIEKPAQCFDMVNRL